MIKTKSNIKQPNKYNIKFEHKLLYIYKSKFFLLLKHSSKVLKLIRLFELNSLYIGILLQSIP